MLNPWWKTGKVPKDIAPKFERKEKALLAKSLNDRRIKIISGLRRVGKSTIIFQTIRTLLEKVSPLRILYFSFDYPSSLFDVLELYQSLTGENLENGTHWLFLDEIQKNRNWDNEVKMIYDRYPKTRLVLSGSAGSFIELKARTILSGRYVIHRIPPLQFDDFLRMVGSEKVLVNPILYEDEIRKLFWEYVKKPYPEIVKSSDAYAMSYMRENVVEKIVRIDMESTHPDVDSMTVELILDRLYSRPGRYMNYDNLSKELSIGKERLIRHISYMADSLLIRMVSNVKLPSMRPSRKLRRIYPYHWSLLFSWNGEEDMETIVASLLDAKYYWRYGKREVDFIIKRNGTCYAVEVNEGKEKTLGNLEYVSEFCRPVVIYNGKLEKGRTKFIPIHLLPLVGI